MEATLHLIRMITLTLSTVIAYSAFASPADPDRPISHFLNKIPYSEISTQSSSVSRGFSERNLFRMKAWRAWGSHPRERVGAWISFKWETSRYLDTIHYVPGDERAPGYFDKMCSRPARLEIRGDFETRTFDLKDVRGHQYIVFDPPMITKTLKFTIKAVRGKSKQAGVCFAAISLYSHREPLMSVPHLKERADEALVLLQKPLMRSVALTRLAALGPVTSPLILDKLRNSTGDEQRLYLESAAELLQKEELKALRTLDKSITLDNRSLYIRVRASIGDESAAQELIERIDELKPDEQAEVLLSVARAGDPKRLSFLLSKYGKHPEVDTILKPYLPDFPKVYKEALTLYKVSQGQKKAAFLELLGKIDPKRSAKLLNKAIGKKDDPMHQSGAVRGAAYSRDNNLRMKVRRLSGSVYVVVRRAVAFALSAWVVSEDASVLRELAADKAMSVRTEALTALGHLGTEGDFLKSYALYGSDESTAEAAAKAWMSGKARLTVSAPLQLLASPFSSVRKSAINAITDHQSDACPKLVEEVLNVDTIYEEHITALNDLWKSCATNFIAAAKNESELGMLRAIKLTRRLKKPEMLDLIKHFATSEDAEVQIAVAKASRLLKAEEAEQLIISYLKSSTVSTRCAAVKSLAHFKSKLSLKVVENGINSGLKDPYSADRAWLICTIAAAGKYVDGEFAPLLAKAYTSWSRSLGFVSYRLKAIKSLAKLKSSPARLETLLKASTDLDKAVRETALKALKGP
jgi:HEAT repeat protein